LKTIIIVVAPDGQSKVETNGFVGNDCQEASRAIEKALGSRTREQLKAEFHQTSATHQQNTTQQ
jgi:hypothetical protein